MAEVVGLVASVISIAELAGRIATSAVALKRLWDEVKEVSESIGILTGQLELLHPFLAEMDIELARKRNTVGNVGAAAFGVQYCRQAAADLESLVDDLQQQICSTKTLKRRVSKVRVSLKKSVMNSYQQRLQSVLSLLSVSQQSYLIPLTQFQSSMIVSEFEAFRQRGEKGPDRSETWQQDSVSPGQSDIYAQANT
ncbi:hypothetical protein VTI28DRAFT_865 [Corynascus sepedonium]